MKIIASIYNNNQLSDKLIKYIDGVVLHVPHYSYVYENLLLDEAINTLKENNKLIILSISRIFMEDELKDIEQFIDKYVGYKFLVSDLGVIELFKEKNRIDEVIYDPSTLVCNSLDLELYQSFGFNAVSVSNEITLEDITKAYNYSKANIFLQIFGRKMMFYSKRKLLSCYKDYRELSFDNKNLYLREEKRDYMIPVYENENGTYCFRQYNISLLKEINNLSFLKYGYFESLNISTDIYEDIIKIYHDCLNNELSVESANESIMKYNLPIEDGFLYEDTTHIKGGN